MEEKKDEINRLIQRFSKKEATPEEVDRLAELAEQNKDWFINFLNEQYVSEPEEHNAESLASFTNVASTIKDELARRRSKTIVMSPATRKIAWAAAAAVIFMGMALIYLMVDRKVGTEQMLVQHSAGNYSGKQYLHLPDGSTVLMNEGSSLSYEPEFGQSVREVTLMGEAYFDIAHDVSKPFIVRTGEVTTRVLGTAFNIRANGNKVVVTVTRGLVEVGENGKALAKIKPEEQITVDTYTHQFTTASVDTTEETKWKAQYLVMENITIEQAARMVEKRYQVTISFTNPQVKNCQLTATFINNERIEKVMKVLSDIAGATYKVEGDHITVVGGSCE